MKKIYITLFALLVLFSITTSFVPFNFHGKTGTGIAGQTGSPSEGTCSGCHSGGSNATTVTINSSPVFVGNEYVQGQTYTITINVDGTGYSKFGFGCEILHIGTNANAGIMANAGAGVKFLNAGTRKNAVQTTPKTGTNTASFSFEWTAPTNGADCKIYAIGNCVNGNGTTSGDFARATSLTLTTPTIANVRQQEKNILKGFQIYPNPVKDDINVSYGLADTKQVKILLTSFTGGVVAELLNEMQENCVYTKHFNIPVDIKAGIYFLNVFANNQKVAQRLVVIN